MTVTGSEDFSWWYKISASMYWHEHQNANNPIHFWVFPSLFAGSSSFRSLLEELVSQ